LIFVGTMVRDVGICIGILEIEADHYNPYVYPKISNTMINFLHTFNPQPILLKLGPIEIHWYGFLMVLGGLIGLFFVIKLGNKAGLDKKIFEDLIIVFTVGAIIFARIYYVIYAWPMYRDNFWEIFKIWQGGLAVHGVMIGGFLAVLIYTRLKKLNFWQIADHAAIGLVTAQIFGRIGNYFNQEIFGKPTDLAWGIPIDLLKRPAEYVDFDYFHPTFLYEVVGNVLVLGILLFLWKYSETMIRDNLLRSTNYGGQARDKADNAKMIGGRSIGIIFLSYLILYSILRFIIGFLRIDYSPMLFGLRWPQVVSLLIIVCCLFFLLRKIVKK